MNKTLKVLIVIITVLVIFLIIGKKQGWIGKGNIIKVSTELVNRRTIVEYVSANGKIQPEIEVKISPDVSGEIIELHVKEGDEVKVGDLLVKINPDVYLASVDRMDAALNSSKANLANSKARFIEAEQAYKRSSKLWEEGVISESEFESAKANIKVSEQNMIASEFNIMSAQASLKEARDRLAKTMIFAPVNGTVYALNIEKGERVVGTSQMTGTELMRLANLNEMEVSVEVNENDIVRVIHGDTTEIDVDAYLDRKFKGIVTEVANSANIAGVSADQVTSFTVKIRILQDSYKDLLDENNPVVSPFRPGMSATVEIQTETAVNVLSVPIQSVTIREDSLTKSDLSQSAGGERVSKKGRKRDDKQLSRQSSDEKIECVFIYVDGTVKLQKVKTGIQDNSYIEILNGLEESQEIISGPYSAISKRLKDGKEVEKVDKKELFSAEK